MIITPAVQHNMPCKAEVHLKGTNVYYKPVFIFVVCETRAMLTATSHWTDTNVHIGDETNIMVQHIL